MTKCPAWGWWGTVEAWASECALAELWERVEGGPKKWSGVGNFGWYARGIGQGWLGSPEITLPSFQESQTSRSRDGRKHHVLLSLSGPGSGSCIVLLVKGTCVTNRTGTDGLHCLPGLSRGRGVCSSD